MIQTLQVADLSLFARDLHRQLAAAAALPGHLALLNMLARAGGYRNYQHLRAQTALAAPVAMTAAPDADAGRPDLRKVDAALRHFDGASRMASWPAKTSLQHLCLWGLWSRLPVGRAMTEREISTFLNDWHRFGDAAILRRSMAEQGMISRDAGVSIYLRIEGAPPAEARALIRALHRRTDP